MSTILKKYSNLFKTFGAVPISDYIINFLFVYKFQPTHLFVLYIIVATRDSHQTIINLVKLWFMIIKVSQTFIFSLLIPSSNVSLSLRYRVATKLYYLFIIRILCSFHQTSGNQNKVPYGFFFFLSWIIIEFLTSRVVCRIL